MNLESDVINDRDLASARLTVTTKSTSAQNYFLCFTETV
ncbi:hypothetical protein TcasGA2_TC002284 [Tribolium castaneum]|uniref:Uncharacterized protein n=1 Tax=Tribolium castaneum TaxID=7070 RepID=D7EHQ4_TRICA|nr:hypothetical protein TcasGA2_TC002284 [Tribolium castaneum]